MDNNARASFRLGGHLAAVVAAAFLLLALGATFASACPAQPTDRQQSDCFVDALPSVTADVLAPLLGIAPDAVLTGPASPALVPSVPRDSETPVARQIAPITPPPRYSS